MARTDLRRLQENEVLRPLIVFVPLIHCCQGACIQLMVWLLILQRGISWKGHWGRSMIDHRVHTDCITCPTDLMTLTLKPRTPPPPFSWDDLPSPSPPQNPVSLPSPPTSWLSPTYMKLFGAQPLTTDIGIVKCNECHKPILRSVVVEHSGQSITYLIRHSFSDSWF